MAGINAGNFLLTSISIDDGNNVNVTPPAGGGMDAARAHRNGGNVGVATYWKFATFADTGAGTWQWGLSSGTRASAIVVRYTGVDTVDPIVDANDDTDTNNAVTAPSVTTNDGNSALVGIFGGRHAEHQRTVHRDLHDDGGMPSPTRRHANGGATSGPSLASGPAPRRPARTPARGRRTRRTLPRDPLGSELAVALHAAPGPGRHL